MLTITLTLQWKQRGSYLPFSVLVRKFVNKSVNI
jgi:hypothetical protein